MAKALGLRARPTTLGRLLRANGLGFPGHRKRLTGKVRADRETQFRYIRAPRRVFVGACHPRISIDAKKRERVGNFKNPGRRWCRRPTDVNAYDFPTAAAAQAVPYGVYDPELDGGHVSSARPGTPPTWRPTPSGTGGGKRGSGSTGTRRPC